MYAFKPDKCTAKDRGEGGNRKFNALQFLLEWPPFLLEKADWRQVLCMQRGRGTAVVGTLEGMYHGENLRQQWHDCSRDEFSR
jgi:hypothetical protein